MIEAATVLVVDDSPENRYAAGRYLGRAGFAIWEAETGAQGLAMAAEDPDLILLDVHLPDIDGFEVCRRLKEDPVTARIPVLQRSQSHVDDAARVHGLESGADAYLAEPVDPTVLIATARALLRVPSFDGAGAVVPLVAYGRSLGALAVETEAPLDRDLLLALAAQGAQALERAGLYEHQRYIATTLQNGLLPRRLPEIPGAEVAARYNAGA